MLGKLFKHEFRETARVLAPLNLVLIAITLIGVILLGARFLQNDIMKLLAVTCMMFYILCIFALFVITGVYLTIRFYRTMYGSQGYLTHTLPVKTALLVNTKILISVFWCFVSLLITIGSVFLLVRVMIGDAWNLMSFQEFNAEMTAAFGMKYGQFFAILGAMLLLSCVQIILMLFSSLSIGQLFGQHRILASIGAFVVFYVLQQLAGVMMTMLFGLRFMGQLTTEAEMMFFASGLYRNLMLSGMIVSLVFCIGYFISCHYITRRYLNLE
ncbi:MAG: hypothetical protein HFJ04_11910 [Lachnospiraceae bacterium]|nr:hypothetical protein [Lachnospiraceae bacterium]